MRVQIISDVHLERRPLEFSMLLDQECQADVLVLAGDIGCPKSSIYEAFLRWCSERYNDVIVICGNHEYRSCIPSSFQDVDERVNHVINSINYKSKGQLHFLQAGKSVVINGANFIGATLWSKFPESNSDIDISAVNKTCTGMNINNNLPFTVASMNKLFQYHLSGIEQAVINGCKKQLKNVIITHHAPLLKTMYKYADYPKNYLYGTDLEPYLRYDIIHTWIYGHTHWNTLHNINGTSVVTNQFGNNNIPCRGWSNSFFINI